jgi:hypothetical protein
MAEVLGMFCLGKQTSKSASMFPSRNMRILKSFVWSWGLVRWTGLSVPAVLEDFRQFMVPALLRMYGHLLKPEQGHRCYRRHRRNLTRGGPREEPRSQTTEVEDPASKFPRGTPCADLSPTDVRPSDRDWDGPRAALWREDRRGSKPCACTRVRLVARSCFGRLDRRSAIYVESRSGRLTKPQTKLAETG